MFSDNQTVLVYAKACEPDDVAASVFLLWESAEVTDGQTGIPRNVKEPVSADRFTFASCSPQHPVSSCKTWLGFSRYLSGMAVECSEKLTAEPIEPEIVILPSMFNILWGINKRKAGGQCVQNHQCLLCFLCKQRHESSIS